MLFCEMLWKLRVLQGFTYSWHALYTRIAAVWAHGDMIHQNVMVPRWHVLDPAPTGDQNRKVNWYIRWSQSGFPRCKIRDPESKKTMRVHSSPTNVPARATLKKWQAIHTCEWERPDILGCHYYVMSLGVVASVMPSWKARRANRTTRPLRIMAPVAHPYRTGFRSAWTRINAVCHPFCISLLSGASCHQSFWVSEYVDAKLLHEGKDKHCWFWQRRTGKRSPTEANWNWNTMTCWVSLNFLTTVMARSLWMWLGVPRIRRPPNHDCCAPTPQTHLA